MLILSFYLDLKKLTLTANYLIIQTRLQQLMQFLELVVSVLKKPDSVNKYELKCMGKVQPKLCMTRDEIWKVRRRKIFLRSCILLEECNWCLTITFVKDAMSKWLEASVITYSCQNVNDRESNGDLYHFSHMCVSSRVS